MIFRDSREAETLFANILFKKVNRLVELFLEAMARFIVGDAIPISVMDITITRINDKKRKKLPRLELDIKVTINTDKTSEEYIRKITMRVENWKDAVTVVIRDEAGNMYYLVKVYDLLNEKRKLKLASVDIINQRIWDIARQAADEYVATDPCRASC